MIFFQVPSSSSSVRVQRNWVWRRLKESLANDKSRWDISKSNVNPLSQQKEINVFQGGSHFWRCWLWEDQPGALHGGEELLRCRGPRPHRGGPCQRGQQHPSQAFWPAGRLPLLPGADDSFCLSILIPFPQADNAPTCLVPHFVHSIAAQLSQAPQLAPYYRHLKVQNPSPLTWD